MRQLTRTTNPTGLKNLDKRLFSVHTHVTSLGRTSFWLEKFDWHQSGMPAGATLTCVAHAGASEEFFLLGSVDKVDREPKMIGGLAKDKPIRFRFMVHPTGDPRLIGFVDGVKPANEAGTFGTSLVDIEPASLKGPVWKLELPEDSSDEKPVLLVEREVFNSGQAAASSALFSAMVMPEVMRRIAYRVAQNSSLLDDPSSWLCHWKLFFEQFNIEDVGEDPSPADCDDWASDVVSNFCARPLMRMQLDRLTIELDGAKK
jgi:hypothetical protein